MIKLVVSDLDRTLLPHGVQEVDEQTIYTIKKLVEKNIYFAIASGRSYKELSKFMKKTKDSIFLICENGALITYRGRILNKKCIEKDKTVNLVNKLEQNGYDCLISGVYTLYTTSKNQSYLRYLNRVKGNVMKIKYADDLPEDPLRISVYKKNRQIIDKPWIVESFKDFNISYYGEEWLDFTGQGVNKGMAVKQIKKSFLSEEDEIMAFGDQDNDKEMLLIADYSCAMIHGSKEIINISNEITENPIKTIQKYIKF